MPIENFAANTIRLRHFDSHQLFNEWVARQKGIIIIHITTMFAGTVRPKDKAEAVVPLWRVLVIYSESPKAD